MDPDEPIHFSHGLDGLRGLDDADVADAHLPRLLPIAPPSAANRIPRKYRRSAGATMLAAGLLGLRDIIEPPSEDEPVVEQRLAGGRPAGPVEVFLNPDDPAASIVVIRDPADDN